jgi:hypothetical protein
MTGNNCAAGFADVGQIVNYYYPPGEGSALETKKLLHEVMVLYSWVSHEACVRLVFESAK